MTEEQWMTAADPKPMLQFLRSKGETSGRKFRLFAVGCCRHIWHLLEDEKSRRAVERAEQYADGGIGLERLVAAYQEADSTLDNSTTTVLGKALALASTAALYAAATEAACLGGVRWELETPDPAYYAFLAAHHVARAAAEAGRAGQDMIATQAAESLLLRDLFGPLPFRSVSIDPSLLRWHDGIVVRLAQAAYENRQLPAGTLEPERLMVLADALEEAGCQDQEGLAHLREQGTAHVRGCWTLDLLLGKS
jgi:hypothetical protein